jgi:hypothetical protein
MAGVVTDPCREQEYDLYNDQGPVQQGHDNQRHEQERHVHDKAPELDPESDEESAEDEDVEESQGSKHFPPLNWDAVRIAPDPATVVEFALPEDGLFGEVSVKGKKRSMVDILDAEPQAKRRRANS